MHEASLYFDHLTATPSPPEAKEVLCDALLSSWASPWAPYHMAQKGVLKIEGALAFIRENVNACEESSFLLTHSGAEASALVLNSIEKKALNEGKKLHIVASLSERLPLMHAFTTLKQRYDARIDLLPVGPKGFIEKESLEEKVTQETSLVMLPFIDPFSGVLQPLDDLGALLKSLSVPLSLDVTLALKKIPLSLQEFDADYVTFDARLLGSPIGIGGIVSAKDKGIVPFLEGDIGSSDSVVRLMLLQALLENKDKDILHSCTETARLRDLFETLLKEAIPSVSFLYQEEDRISFLSTALFVGVKNEALLYLLQKKNLFASLGGGDLQSLSAQLFERGYSPEKAQGALTFSFSNATQESEIKEGIRRIREAYESLSRLSPRGVYG